MSVVFYFLLQVAVIRKSILFHAGRHRCGTERCTLGTQMLLGVPECESLMQARWSRAKRWLCQELQAQEERSDALTPLRVLLSF